MSVFGISHKFAVMTSIVNSGLQLKTLQVGLALVAMVN